MWKIKDIWSSLQRSGEKVVKTSNGDIVSKKYYYKNRSYYSFYLNNNSLKRLVFFVHGYTDTPLLGLTTALDLALEGFYVVLPEAKWHGMEKPNNFKQLFSSNTFIFSIFKVFEETVKGIIDITNYLQSNEIVKQGDTGISGFSMGGYLSYILPLLDKRFVVSAPVSGSPYHYDEKAEKHFNINVNSKQKAMTKIPQPSNYINKLTDVKWLIQHANDDATVSSTGSIKFTSLLSQNGARNFKALFYEIGGHKYNSYMKDELVKWFKKYLK